MFVDQIPAQCRVNIYSVYPIFAGHVESRMFPKVKVVYVESSTLHIGDISNVSILEK